MHQVICASKIKWRRKKILERNNKDNALQICWGLHFKQNSKQKISTRVYQMKIKGL